ncbi:hypothetical protein ACFO1B_15420 [Dactylosporangium siamense]|uniref:DUF4126 domain-containing protein n=1 Tax=Dactylosporangium siamense TaxID=685454 RepID=A0A919PI37_9ACTN|nr:hypothetical protein [Dactylosporangium siamense]GIG45226.1 hypothetical protein Dsi01nite_032670 [Dactylosporangium siamense]
MTTLLRAAALGAAAGARSVTPVAVLALRRPGWGRAVAGVAALGELVADKLPRTPSRLKPAPLAGRIVLGAVAGAGYARRQGVAPVVPALAAAAAALAASYAGARWRAYAARSSFSVPAAVAEDAAAVALAWVSARR